MAKFYGVELVGNSVKENHGILNGFANGSYAKIKAPFEPMNKSIEAVVEFETDTKVDAFAGVLNSLDKNGYSPLFISGGRLKSYLSSNGTSWDISGGTSTGLSISPQTTYRIKSSWDGKAYSWHLWEKGHWRKLSEIACQSPVFSGAYVQFGTGRAKDHPFSGIIDLNKSYICIDGKLWWEGVKGAYRNANK